MYVDFLKGAKDFNALKQDDGLTYDVYGIKDGFVIEVIVTESAGNRIFIMPEKYLH
ncbi:MAG: hypothetical protein PHP51_03600 [Desulfotomaculaceae bacterium]|nr:hypothetical protein [Desulfotomaculaceae bacterium]MDD4767416.1 hypothetical protein [Desulfotomaculaceae bacterium]